MPRPIWKGLITFGLVNIPVILYPAEKQNELHFHLVDRRDKERIRYVRVNEKTGKEVPWEEISKGYEYNEHKYVLLSEDDFKNIATENSKTIEIESFINQTSLDYMDFDKPYYLVPDKRGEKGYVILRETLKNTKKIGITKVIIHTRQYLAALIPYENALVLNLLRYHNEIRKPDEFEIPASNSKHLKITSKELDVAKQLILSMTIKWHPEKYKNEYQEILQEWIEEKIHQKSSKKKKTIASPKQSNVINFVDLLKKSIQNKKSKKNPERRIK